VTYGPASRLPTLCTSVTGVNIFIDVLACPGPVVVRQILRSELVLYNATKFRKDVFESWCHIVTSPISTWASQSQDRNGFIINRLDLTVFILTARLNVMRDRKEGGYGRAQRRIRRKEQRSTDNSWMSTSESYTTKLKAKTNLRDVTANMVMR
jgi:hypothetical protein